MHDRRDQSLPDKVNKILNVILIALFLIILRVWHLAVIQYDERLEQSQKPQHRTILEPARRGTIRDRHNQPMAVNAIKYSAAILYSQLREIPAVAWEKGPDGKKIKRFKRREYIARLSQLLAHELKLEATRIEDLIHAKASFYYQMPFVIKEDLSEKEYYRLKMLEKDWKGIHVQHLPRRSYPQGKVGADVVGYMGAINREEYERILHEIADLEGYLEAYNEAEEPDRVTLEEAKARLHALSEQAYSINDTIGKAGIESSCERLLRGYQGRKTFYSDARGNFLRELAGSRPPLSGQRILLTLSSELQEYAEKLLAQNEKIRQARISNNDGRPITGGNHQPWIKGGAIIAIDPKTGEILALASYPRFDPNDFIMSSDREVSRDKKSRIGKWLESDLYVGEIWDQKRPLERERFDESRGAFYDEALPMTWEHFLQRVLPKEHPVLEEIKSMGTIDRAIALQRQVDKLMALSGQSDARLLFNELFQGQGEVPFSLKYDPKAKRTLSAVLLEHAFAIEQFRRETHRHFGHLRLHYDKLLLVDLCRVCVRESGFSQALIEKRGKVTLGEYRQLCAAKVAIEDIVKGMSAELFREMSFIPWRQKGEKAFLKIKRAEEKASKTYQRPYIDYLDAEERRQFQIFWEEHRWHLLETFLMGKNSGDPALQEYEDHFNAWHREISLGAHQELAWRAHYMILQRSLEGLDKGLALEYLKTMRGFKELDRPLLGRYRPLRHQNQQQLEKHLAAAFYPKQGFGYGRSQTYRQAAPQGSIFKLVTAYAALTQRYQEIGNPHVSAKELNPLEMIDQTHKRGKLTYVGFDKQGNPIPRSYKGGRLPRSPNTKGKLDLLRAIECSSNPYFSLLAGDILHDPDDLAKAAQSFSFGSKTGISLPAEITGQIPLDLATNRTGLYSTAIGQHTLVVTPLQTALMLSAMANGGHILHPQIIRMRVKDKGSMMKMVPKEKWKIPFSPLVQEILIEGMRRVVIKTREESIGRLSRIYREYPEAISDYLDVKDDLVGKTSTAEMMENISLDYLQGTNLYKHVWFGGISFEDATHKNPELVVVVYLRFGIYGKEAAPVAAQIVKKWREIKSALKKS